MDSKPTRQWLVTADPNALILRKRESRRVARAVAILQKKHAQEPVQVLRKAARTRREFLTQLVLEHPEAP
jgi:hypothetical protein